MKKELPAALIPSAVYPPTWYAATCDENLTRDALCGQHKAEVCVIGAGLAGYCRHKMPVIRELHAGVRVAENRSANARNRKITSLGLRI